MPTPDYDNTILGQYIKAIENPTKEGLVGNRWYQSSRKVDDSDNRGWGVDIEENTKASSIVKDRPGKWLTTEEEKALRNEHIQYALDKVDEYYLPYLRNQDLSDKKRIIGAGMIYRGDGINPHKEVSDAYYNGSDSAFQEAVRKFYDAEGTPHYQPVRAKRHQDFFTEDPEPPESIKRPEPYKVRKDFQDLEYKPPIQFGDGGSLESPKTWDKLSMREKAEMMRVAVRHGITNLKDIREKYNEFACGGHLYGGTTEKTQQMRRGYVPSDAIKKRIEQYEGKAMTGATDPLSGKWARNNSFEAEARGFYNALPAGIRDEVLSNPELADSLYSYSYNVGAGNFRKRVVPALERYYSGMGSADDVARSMWASGDKKLRGLQRRRAEERAGVMSALSGGQPQYTDTGMDVPAFMPSNPEAFFAPLSTYERPVVVEETPQPLVEAAMAYDPKELERLERQDNMRRFGLFMSMLNPQGGDGLTSTISMLNGNGYAGGGRLYSGEDEPTGQMSRPNIYRYNDGRYVYQETPESAEIPVHPVNTLLSDPSKWTYTDTEGKLYTPRVESQSKTAELSQGEEMNPLVGAANNYFRELQWRLKNDPASIALKGKYTMPAIALAATGIGGFIDSPITATATLVEGDLAGRGVDWFSRRLTGKNWGENVSDWTGLDYTLASMTNPGYIIGGQAGYSGGKTVARGVKQDRLLGKFFTPEEAAAYRRIYGRDISELQNQTAVRALLKGSPNLGNEYGLFDTANPIYYPKNLTSWIAEVGNYTLPFSGPVKTPARFVARNIASQSSSPERIKVDLHSMTHKGPFNGIIGSDTGFPSDIEKSYPGINFVDYYLWRKDPLLKWAPSVRTTARYFRENPAPFRTSFGEKYDLYGNVPQGQMPLKSVDTHLRETAAFSLPGHRATPFKTEEGITKLGVSRMMDAHKFSEDIEPLRFREWSGMGDLWNSSVPELNIAGHQVFVDPTNNEVLSRDIWKYNPWDWRQKWKTLGGKSAQAGIMDKLGTPFITTSKVPLSPEAITFLNNK